VMANSSVWSLLGIGFVAGAPVWGIGGYIVARIQVVSRRIARDWRGVKGVLKAGAVTVAMLIGVTLVGIRYYHPFGLFG
jgi:hypothetical protein